MECAVFDSSQNEHGTLHYILSTCRPFSKALSKVLWSAMKLFGNMALKISTLQQMSRLLTWQLFLLSDG